jgi:hypothetical protein
MSDPRQTPEHRERLREHRLEEWKHQRAIEAAALRRHREAERARVMTELAKVQAAKCSPARSREQVLATLRALAHREAPQRKLVAA